MTDDGNIELILGANTSALLSSKYQFTSSVIVMHEVPYLFGGHTEANLSLHSRYCGPDSGHRIHHGCHRLRGVSKGQYFDMC